MHAAPNSLFVHALVYQVLKHAHEHHPLTKGVLRAAAAVTPAFCEASYALFTARYGTCCVYLFLVHISKGLCTVTDGTKAR